MQVLPLFSHLSHPHVCFKNDELKFIHGLTKKGSKANQFICSDSPFFRSLVWRHAPINYVEVGSRRSGRPEFTSRSSIY